MSVSVRASPFGRVSVVSRWSPRAGKGKDQGPGVHYADNCGTGPADVLSAPDARSRVDPSSNKSRGLRTSVVPPSMTCK